MILSDFCDEQGHVHTAVKLTGVSVHFTGDDALTSEKRAEISVKRAQILVSRRFLIIDENVTDLRHHTFDPMFVLLPGMLFEVLADQEVRDLVRFEFDGVALSPTECLAYVQLTEEEKT